MLSNSLDMNFPEKIYYKKPKQYCIKKKFIIKNKLLNPNTNFQSKSSTRI